MEDNLTLSGRTFVARIPFASSEALRAAIGDGAMTEDGRQPLVGDIRLSATLSIETRGKAHPATPCVGVLQASIFDGWCWQRFEIASLTGMYKFTSEVQLRGVLGWANRAVHDARGRACRRVTGANGFPLYELIPVAPSTSERPSSPPPATPPADRTLPPSPVVTTVRGATQRSGPSSAN